MGAGLTDRLKGKRQRERAGENLRLDTVTDLTAVSRKKCPQGVIRLTKALKPSSPAQPASSSSSPITANLGRIMWLTSNFVSNYRDIINTGLHFFSCKCLCCINFCLCHIFKTYLTNVITCNQSWIPCSNFHLVDWHLRTLNTITICVTVTVENDCLSLLSISYAALTTSVHHDGTMILKDKLHFFVSKKIIWNIPHSYNSWLCFLVAGFFFWQSRAFLTDNQAPRNPDC